MNLSELRRVAKLYGVTINTNAPGDGVRRFEFASPKWGLLGRALGIAHAETWLDGFMAYADKVADTPMDRMPGRTNPPRRRRLVKQSNTDPREIRAVYGGSTYWLRKSGRDNWTLTGDGQHLAGPGSYSTMLEAFMSVTGMESKPWVMIWEERGDIAITLFLGTPDDATGSIEIAQWRDDDARQMVEDGFFKSGRQLEQSVIEYGQEMGLIP